METKICINHQFSISPWGPGMSCWMITMYEFGIIIQHFFCLTTSMDMLKESSKVVYSPFTIGS